ncbi:hypothetical protein CBR_g39708 [Chara braunii]|uniref:Uncharacterized protein n=1 Tax=Chara braunii TaxID=69332 RepID=A0A388LSH1_CHABU|nr:hypothetical protein CBR_g39708 [Chara braunii]|eukprot:GBG85142.1 hypothetical protein CBR_g39708 [Chara braunii]
MLPSPEQLVCCWARRDNSKVRRKARTESIRHRRFQSVSTMAAMVVPLLLGLLHLAVAGLAQSPPPGTVQIESFTYSGSGCPPGSVSFDEPMLTVIFSSDAPEGRRHRRKNCQLEFRLSYPTGFVFTLERVTFRGYAQFEQGAKASLATEYSLSGIPESVRVVRNLPPPVEGNFEFTEQFNTFIYPPCSSDSVLFIIKFQARVPPPPSSITDVSLQFVLRWKKC